MKKFFFLISIVLFRNIFAQTPATTLVFDSPASHFTESLPIGNGRLGAMILGDTKNDRIILNEISMWSGGKIQADSPNAHTYLKKIQQLLIEGKNQQAQQLLQKHFVTEPQKGTCWGNGKDCHFGSYQMLGNLIIQWQKEGEITNYRRELHLEKPQTKTTYLLNNQKITQKTFADFQNDILWISIEGEKPILNFHLTLNRQENAQTSVTNSNTLLMQGQLTNGKEKGLSFLALSHISSNGKQSISENKIQIENASRVLIKIAMRTNYNFQTGDLTSENLLQICQNDLKKTENISYNEALEKSVQQFQKYFNRNRWEMPISNSEIAPKTTWERLKNYFENGDDNQLPILYYNFGRYLLICSSRPGLLPANLQGLWADSYQTPWNGDYHLNINVQMNYWLAEATHLSELAQPLFQFTKNLVPNGRKTAKNYYNAKGWVAHVVANPWYFTSPGEGADWGSTLTGGAWLCQHIWEHFRYTKNKDFLKKYYPVLKEAALFLQAILITDPKTGYWVTAPSNSPEHAYKFTSEDGKLLHLNTCMGPTMDMQITRELFSNVIKASEILKTDKKFRLQLKEKIKQLAPNRIGKDGDINEWLEDWEDSDPKHRHISHLYGLHPYDEITPWDTPDLAKAAQKTLEVRGDGGTGWSRAWKINFWARLGNGNHALKLFHELLKPVSVHPQKGQHGGGTYANLFCSHPPFQIDGNFGGTAGLSEMLMQSHGKNEIIRLLPALPSHPSWQKGTITGMKARGGFLVDFQWEFGKVEEIKITSEKGGVCKILLDPYFIVRDKKGKILAPIFSKGPNLENKKIVVEFNTQKNKEYFIHRYVQ